MGELVRVGCAGWSIRSDNAKHFGHLGSHLERYAAVFNCCEVNSSFYRPHRTSTWERWANSVAEDFRFSVKAPRAITHESGLNGSEVQLKDFLHQIGFLREKLGPVLFQLPPKLAFNNAVAAKFLALLRRSYSGDVAWEPRHPSWFGDQAEALLRDYKISRVMADPACHPNASEPGGDPGIAYFRLHGSPRMYYSSYTDAYLEQLFDRMIDLTTSAKVWCIFDNTAEGQAVRNALSLAGKLAGFACTERDVI